MEIKDLAGLSQPLTKLIEVCSAGIGKIYEPKHIRRTAKARADEIKILAEAIENHSYLPVKYENGNVIIDNSKQCDLVMRAQERLLFQETQKQQNIESVIANAYHELENEKVVSDSLVDNDWISRFFNSVEDISNEDMQKIWGKILAGEIKQPKTYSFRTLSALKNLTSDEARLFERISKYLGFSDVDNICHLPRYNEYRKSRYTLKELLELQDCGIIYTSGSLSIPCPLISGKNIILQSSSLVVCAEAKRNYDKFCINVYRLTDFGSQLLRIINPSDSDEEILGLARAISGENSFLKFTVHRFFSKDGNGIPIYDESEDLLKHYFTL